MHQSVCTYFCWRPQIKDFFKSQKVNKRLYVELKKNLCAILTYSNNFFYIFENIFSRNLLEDPWMTIIILQFG